MKALVVDDSRAMRLILRNHLAALGFEVRDAVSGRDAFVQLNQMEGADIILLDWNMPEMDGFEFLHELRADADHSGTPVVMVTTESEMSQVSRALDAGANEYLMKPFSRESLLEKLVLMGFDIGEAAA